MKKEFIDSGGLLAIWPSIQKVPDSVVLELGEEYAKVVAGLVLDSPAKQTEAAREVVRYAELRGCSLDQAWAAFTVVAMGLEINREIANLAEVGPAHMLAYLHLVLDHARRLKPCGN